MRACNRLLNGRKTLCADRMLHLTGILGCNLRPKVAAEDACKMEHAISAESFSAIKKSIAGTHENYSNPRK